MSIEIPEHDSEEHIQRSDYPRGSRASDPYPHGDGTPLGFPAQTIPADPEVIPTPVSNSPQPPIENESDG